MGNLKFYWARLKNASWLELLHRAGGAVMTWQWRTSFRQGNLGLVKVPEIDLTVLEALQLPDIAGETDEQTGGRLLAGEVFTLNEDRAALERFEIKYRGIFFADIPLYHSGIDIRSVWEQGRLQHIMLLLLACCANPGGGGLREFQAAAQKALLEWIEEHPFLSGPHYMSAMECGLRIPVFFLH